tara:strand:- start:31 stop:498 length:468 start_codon:yes stop_codon:yes gene_type:complete
MKKFKKKVIVFLCICLLGCSSKDDNKFIGQILGSAAGAYLGSKIGSGISNNLAIVLGGAVGLLIGGKVAEALDEDEQLDLSNDVNESLEENENYEVKEWSSKKNKDKTAEIIPLNKYNIDEETCRDFKKIVSSEGKIIEESSTACRDENGNWKII